MGEILVEVRKSSKGGLVGKTENNEEINLSLPCPEIGFLGKLPGEIKSSDSFDKWKDKMVRKEILDNQPNNKYIRLNSSMILSDGTVLVPYDAYSRID
jgi:predicted secreted protein